MHTQGNLLQHWTEIQCKQQMLYTPVTKGLESTQGNGAQAPGSAPQAYLSASSRMSTSMLLRWKEGQLWRWSMSRPGVAMRMSGAARRAAS